jgi:hypothetical protein
MLYVGKVLDSKKMLLYGGLSGLENDSNAEKT